MSNHFHANEHDYNKTLFQVLEQGLAIKYKCTQCGVELDLDILDLIKKHGRETRLRYVQRIAQCTICPT